MNKKKPGESGRFSLIRLFKVLYIHSLKLKNQSGKGEVMGIVNCRECKEKVSSQAKSCPQCGIKNPAPSSQVGKFFKIGLAGVLIAGIVRCIDNQNDRAATAETKREQMENAKSSVERAAEIAKKKENEARFQSAVFRVRALRSSAKNPASFQLVGADLTGDDTLCVVYRATNSFNAVVTEHKAIGTSGREVDWNRSCAGKTVENVDYIRQAL